jgi:hypothetical protein
MYGIHIKDDELSSKAASQELLGALQLQSQFDESFVFIFVPVQTVIDFKGTFLSSILTFYLRNCH